MERYVYACLLSKLIIYFSFMVPWKKSIMSPPSKIKVPFSLEENWKHDRVCCVHQHVNVKNTVSMTLLSTCILEAFWTLQCLGFVKSWGSWKHSLRLSTKGKRKKEICTLFLFITHCAAVLGSGDIFNPPFPQVWQPHPTMLQIIKRL